MVHRRENSAVPGVTQQRNFLKPRFYAPSLCKHDYRELACALSSQILDYGVRHRICAKEVLPMPRWRRYVLFITIIGLGIYCLTTGGVVVINWDDFGGQRDITLIGGLKCDVWLAPHMRFIEVPPLFHYHRGRGPFALRLQIWDTEKEYRSIRITEILLYYGDGEVVTRKEDWKRDLEHYVQHNSSSSGITQTHMMMLSDTVEGLVLRHVDVTIVVRGELEKASGERIPFGASERFRPESRFDLSTYWESLAGC